MNLGNSIISAKERIRASSPWHETLLTATAFTARLPVLHGVNRLDTIMGFNGIHNAVFTKLTEQAMNNHDITK